MRTLVNLAREPNSRIRSLRGGLGVSAFGHMSGRTRRESGQLLALRQLIAIPTYSRHQPDTHALLMLTWSANRVPCVSVSVMNCASPVGILFLLANFSGRPPYASCIAPCGWVVAGLRARTLLHQPIETRSLGSGLTRQAWKATRTIDLTYMSLVTIRASAYGRGILYLALTLSSCKSVQIWQPLLAS